MADDIERMERETAMLQRILDDQREKINAIREKIPNADREEKLAFQQQLRTWTAQEWSLPELVMALQEAEDALGEENN